MPKLPKTDIKRPGTSDETIRRKRSRGICLFNRCTSPQGAKKKYCHRHHQQDYKARHFLTATYYTRKSKAKARGIEWRLSLEEFKQLVAGSGYLQQSKIWKKKLSIDRRRAWNPDGTPAPYTLENCRIIGYSANCSKGSYERGGQNLPPELETENNLSDFAQRAAPF